MYGAFEPGSAPAGPPSAVMSRQADVQRSRTVGVWWVT